MARMNIDVSNGSTESAIVQAAVFIDRSPLHLRLSESDLKSTIERLKASKAQIVNRIAEGVDAGKRWAMADAEYLDLKKVGAELKQAFSFKRDQIDAVIKEETESFLEFPALRNGSYPPGAKSSGAHFEHGFCVGVHEVWALVEDKI